MFCEYFAKTGTISFNIRNRPKMAFTILFMSNIFKKAKWQPCSRHTRRCKNSVKKHWHEHVNSQTLFQFSTKLGKIESCLILEPHCRVATCYFCMRKTHSFSMPGGPNQGCFVFENQGKNALQCITFSLGRFLLKQNI